MVSRGHEINYPVSPIGGGQIILVDIKNNILIMIIMKLFPFASLFMCVSSYNLLPRSSNYLYLKRRVSFYPARLKTPVPKELYHNFLDELKENYDVNNNTELLDKNQTEV